MTLRELKVQIDAELEGQPDYYDPKVMVVVQNDKAIGSTPSVEVKAAHQGFDWDSWQFMLLTEEKLIVEKS